MAYNAPIVKVEDVIIKEHYVVSSRTDIGLLRQYNEDSLYVCGLDLNTTSHGLLVGVADGMGGHNGGDVASQLAVKTLNSYYEKEASDCSTADLLERLIHVVEEANSAIYNVSSENEGLCGMGTTLTSVCMKNSEALIAHVGDSRAYLYRDNVLTQLTDDHSLVAQAVREGILTPEQAAKHPQRNIITRALGTKDTVEVDSLIIKVQKDDLLLLSSDGLHGFVDDPEISDILSSQYDSLDDVTDDLIKGALEKGGPDNVTVVLAKVAE